MTTEGYEVWKLKGKSAFARGSSEDEIQALKRFIPDDYAEALEEGYQIAKENAEHFKNAQKEPFRNRKPVEK